MDGWPAGTMDGLGLLGVGRTEYACWLVKNFLRFRKNSFEDFFLTLNRNVRKCKFLYVYVAYFDIGSSKLFFLDIYKLAVL